MPSVVGPQAIPSQCTLVLGMHRSGTSVLASYLHSRGCAIGERLVGPLGGNPRGHYEDEDFVQFHRDIIRNRTASPLDVLVPDGFRFEPEPRDEERAAELIGGRRAHAWWGWKDPRTCLFVDFWLDRLPRPSVLAVFRHPLEVYDSLLRRNTDPGIRSEDDRIFASYTAHNRGILRALDRLPGRSILIAAPHGLAHEDKLDALLARVTRRAIRATRPWVYHPEEFGTLPITRALHELFSTFFPDAAGVFDALNSRADDPYRVSADGACATACDLIAKAAGQLPHHDRGLWTPLLLQWLGSRWDFRREEIEHLRRELEEAQARLASGPRPLAPPERIPDPVPSLLRKLARLSPGRRQQGGHA